MAATSPVNVCRLENTPVPCVPPALPVAMAVRNMLLKTLAQLSPLTFPELSTFMFITSKYDLLIFVCVKISDNFK